MHIEEIRTLSATRLLLVGFGRVRGRGSGIEFDQPAAGVIELEGDRVVRVSIHLGEADAIAAAARE